MFSYNIQFSFGKAQPLVNNPLLSVYEPALHVHKHIRELIIIV